MEDRVSHVLWPLRVLRDAIWANEQSGHIQAYINKALSGLVDVICVVYLNNILIYSENLEDHRQHVREVFERLRRFSLYANLKKCSFFQTEVEFLGFIVGRQGTRMDPKRVEAVT
jgi:hypothetical protein